MKLTGQTDHNLTEIKMNWIVTETSKEGNVANFGPFKTIDDALDFSKNSRFPWSEDFLKSITIQQTT